jgi:hypothetical protein
MLSQKFQLRDAVTQKGKEFFYRDEVDESDLIRVSGYSYPRSSILSPFKIALRLCIFTLIICSLSCGTKPTDLRAFIPTDALVYLETNDLGGALRSVTENEAFKAAAKTQPDFSALAGMKLAVAVTGFETKEQQVTEENSVLNFKPRFVAVAETNGWNYQALSFTENKLGEFINETYGGEVALETSDKHSGKYFVWTAQDGRKAYALVRGSLIFFGNDESAIEKCLAVSRGETDGIAKNPKIIALPADSLASGYVSTDGIAQISNIAAISMAKTSSEESEVQSFIARVLPELLRNTVTDMSWTSTKTQWGIDDKYDIGLNPDVAKVANETLTAENFQEYDFAEFVPLEFVSATRYNLIDPRLAWRSVLLTVQSKTDSLSGKLIADFSSSFFEPYAIEDAELFLKSIDERVMTVKYDADGENAVAIASVKNASDLKKSIAKEINLAVPQEKQGEADIWRSGDGELAVAFTGNIVIVGDADTVGKCLTAKQSGENITKIERFKRFEITTASAITIANEIDPAAAIVDTLGERKDETAPLSQRSFTATWFDEQGMHRATLSSFGMIGSIIAQLGKE